MKLRYLNMKTWRPVKCYSLDVSGMPPSTVFVEAEQDAIDVPRETVVRFRITDGPSVMDFDALVERTMTLGKSGFTLYVVR